MESKAIGNQLLLGALAGLAGTVALQVLRTLDQKYIPHSEAPIREDPGQFMVRKAKQVLPRAAREKMPPKLEQAVVRLSPVGYGMTLGALYALLRGRPRHALGDGLGFGIAAWALGFLGWLPSTRLMPPIWRHKPRQMLVPVAEHLVYGLGTVSGYRLLRGLAESAPGASPWGRRRPLARLAQQLTF